MSRHPAKYSDSIIGVMREVIKERDIRGVVLDPFAGTGRCYELEEVTDIQVIGVELEREGNPRNVVADCIEWMRRQGIRPDAIFTSPCYGNRFADKDMRESCAGTYMKWLGHEASEGSACHLQWGPRYKAFHILFLIAAFDLLRSGGAFVLNMSNHIRGEEEMLVVEWWIETAKSIGFVLADSISVTTPRQRKGANHAARVECEWVLVFTKP